MRAFTMSRAVPKAVFCLNPCVSSAELHCYRLLSWLLALLASCLPNHSLILRASDTCLERCLLFALDYKHFKTAMKRETWTIHFFCKERAMECADQIGFREATKSLEAKLSTMHIVWLWFLPLLGEIILSSAALPSQYDFESTLLSLTQLLMVY